MPIRKSKSFYTPFGSFIFGYSFAGFGVGLRVDYFGLSIDFAWFWFAWER